MGSMAIEPSMSDSSDSTPEPAPSSSTAAAKRSSSDAGLKSTSLRPAKSVKRRASKACQCCRARKVRCNVVEHGAPCTNCRLDEVECIVSESKRKKKWTNSADLAVPVIGKPPPPVFEPVDPLPMSAAPPYEPLRRHSEHVPHSLYQDLGPDFSLGHGDPRSSMYNSSVLMQLQRLGQQQQQQQQRQHQRSATLQHPRADPAMLTQRLLSPAAAPSGGLPAYIKPLSARLGSDDLAYLEKKGALTIPSVSLRDELLRSYAECVHPYMPLLSLQELVTGIDRRDGSYQISLLLFQSIMFVSVATADMHYLRQAGYSSRRDARRDFFQKTRILYDFDVEIDRISLIQSLLLMSYWYETPDDLKDSHHWMGIAVSLAHSIGLHRNPEKSSHMDLGRERLWRRIWWATYMRDRLIALGMRRPTRIKNSDFDVPMLTLDDFDLAALPKGVGPSCMPARCKVMRDSDVQRQLAIMCIEKAKLCIAMSHVLSVQYSVLHNNHGVLSDEGTTTRTTMMLVAKQLEPELEEVQACDRELHRWRDSLPLEARYVVPAWQDIEVGNDSIVLNRALLHMMYYATLSALHRPQVLPSSSPASASPSSAASPPPPPRHAPADMIELSRRSVRLAATEITSIANTLDKLGLIRCLPTTGVTVLLPAIIIHLLDIKAPDEATRRASLKGFCECMQIMAKLRDIYAAADYSTAFLEAAIRKAEITLPQKPNEVKDARNVITSTQGLVDAGRRLQLVETPASGTLTPPPDDAYARLQRARAAEQDEEEEEEEEEDEDEDEDEDHTRHNHSHPHLAEHPLALKLNNYLASTPPDSSSDDLGGGSSSHGHGGGLDFTTAGAASATGAGAADYEPDFDSLIDLDAAGDVWSLEDSAYAAMQGESSGFTMDMDWIKGMRPEEGLVGL